MDMLFYCYALLPIPVILFGFSVTFAAVNLLIFTSNINRMDYFFILSFSHTICLQRNSQVFYARK